MSSKQPTRVDQFSLVSVRLVLHRAGESTGMATGVLVHNEKRWFLVSNYHVLAGRDPITNTPQNQHGLLPDEVQVWIRRSPKHFDWGAWRFPLLDRTQMPLFAHAAVPPVVDLTALPIEMPEGAAPQALPLGLCWEDLFTEVGMEVAVVGFPFDITGGGVLPVWKTGHIASEPLVPLPDLGGPCFLVDASTRGGMSGSPVYQRSYGFHRTEDGKLQSPSGTRTKWLGIYSGRVFPSKAVREADPEAQLSTDIGIVWKPDAVRDLLGIAAALDPVRGWPEEGKRVFF